MATGDLGGGSCQDQSRSASDSPQLCGGDGTPEQLLPRGYVSSVLEDSGTGQRGLCKNSRSLTRDGVTSERVRRNTFNRNLRNEARRGDARTKL